MELGSKYITIADTTKKILWWERGNSKAVPAHKIEALDSVRGIAAFIVIFWHFASIFYPAAMSGIGSPVHSQYDLLIYKSPLSIFLTGNFAVVIFFLLSGFVLTVRFFSTPNASLFPAAVKRYFRLMPVVLGSVLIGYAFMTLGLMHFKEVTPITGSGYANVYFLFDPSLVGAIFQGVFSTFIAQQGILSYNPVLWTIYYEMLGSLLVFGLATVAKGNSKRWLLYVIASVMFIDSYFVPFIVGLALADLYSSRPSFFAKIGSMASAYKWFFLIFALSIAAFPVVGDQAHWGKYWETLTLFKTSLGLSKMILQLIAGTILISLALSWKGMINVLEKKPLLWLGKISFTLYAVHFLILYSLTCWLDFKLYPHFNYNAAALLALAFSLPVMFGVAAVLHKYLEVPSIKAANKIGAWAKD